MNPDDILEEISLTERVERLEKLVADTEAWHLQDQLYELEGQLKATQRELVRVV